MRFPTKMKFPLTYRNFSL